MSRRYTEAEVRTLFTMRAEGKSWPAIAKALGRHRHGVMGAYKRRGGVTRQFQERNPGDVVGNWTLIERVPSDHQSLWRCRCKCNRSTTVSQPAALPRRCRLCAINENTKPAHCSSCGTTDKTAFRNIKHRCERCDRRGHRNGFCLCGAALIHFGCPRGCCRTDNGGVCACGRRFKQAHGVTSCEKCAKDYVRMCREADKQRAAKERLTERERAKAVREAERVAREAVRASIPKRPRGRPFTYKPGQVIGGRTLVRYVKRGWEAVCSGGHRSVIVPSVYASSKARECYRCEMGLPADAPVSVMRAEACPTCNGTTPCELCAVAVPA